MACKTVAAPQVLQAMGNRTTFHPKTHGPKHAQDCEHGPGILLLIEIEQHCFGPIIAVAQWHGKSLVNQLEIRSRKGIIHGPVAALLQ